VLFFNAFELGIVILRRCSGKGARKELEAKRESKRKYETLLSLPHFLCKGIL
jgi:hypothetical protein